jgi:hypothetical protein
MTQSDVYIVPRAVQTYIGIRNETCVVCYVADIPNPQLGTTIRHGWHVCPQHEARLYDDQVVELVL